MLNVSLYFNTLRYLRPVQIYGLLWRKIYHPKPDLSPSPAIRSHAGTWQVDTKKSPSLIAHNRFRFLNENHDILSSSDWNHPNCTKLWLYNLHYFDDLNAAEATDRLEWHRSLISRWVIENPPGTSNGWEPYPLSLRIVNWIKWALTGNSLTLVALESLATQVRFLAKRTEFHLMGNHLFANAKALVFGGLFFEGKEADAWIEKGIRILNRELFEQILEDGGHFERSPMYHCIILQDLLDLINLMLTYADSPTVSGAFTNRSYYHLQDQKRLHCLAPRLAEAARRMITWLKIMCYPNGQIALFNDAAFGIASHPVELYAYAGRLGIYEPSNLPVKRPSLEIRSIEFLSFGPIKLTHLKTTGYIRVENGPMTAILDTAPIGSDYLPGHAHADTLSFELYFHDQMVIVDSGTSRYDHGPERMLQRGTAAHNTVVINRKNSSEIWKSFRVARRAHPFGLEIKETTTGTVVVRCAHDGYQQLPGKPVHWREWHFGKKSLTIRDVIAGRDSNAVGYMHFHPSITLLHGKNLSKGEIRLSNVTKMKWHISNGDVCIVNSTYHPEFGTCYQNQCLEIRLNSNSSQIVLDWNI